MLLHTSSYIENALYLWNISRRSVNGSGAKQVAEFELVSPLEDPPSVIVLMSNKNVGFSFTLTFNYNSKQDK